LALGTTDHARPPESNAFSAKSEIFQPFRFGYSVISNQFSIDWRGAVGMYNPLHQRAGEGGAWAVPPSQRAPLGLAAPAL
jgi:hypothetical protein